eukprot:CAMPEP_0114442008 /NCGR_PEP_ID=MMETSP0103-20121206/16691_1 /TAXON_ID=37642 ORGANISM="Paraphysomonas imperforata, Strain PA2" /NCGR_SAMPLE_ID=MMETSP0103 /ASSEMBLY_ACC=CAM_ASM_000201 /LENGTH=117 /DNA_ID=CAMNT_0001613185 /DNA_START=106 /DNA_END=455 /DNA_ORIENTATION=+
MQDSLVTLPANDLVPDPAAGGSSRKAIDHEWTFFVGDIARDVTREEVVALFSTHGTVEDVTLKKPPSTTALKYGFIAMSSKEEMDECVAMDKQLTLRDKKLRLAYTRRNSRLLISNL